MSFIVAMENVCYLFAKLLCSQCTKGQTNRKAEIRRSTMAQGLLNGTVVLDLTRVLAGPYCGMLLADMGLKTIVPEPWKSCISDTMN